MIVLSLRGKQLLAAWVKMLVVGLASCLLLLRRRRRAKCMPVVRSALRKARGRVKKARKALQAVVPMEGQLGGLGHAETRSMLVARQAGLALKPVHSKGLGEREVAFYEYNLMKSDLRKFLCGYHGVVDHENFPYLCLDDATRGKQYACAMDVKIGTKTYEEEASPEKKSREINRYREQATLGCRIVGMRLWDGSEFVTYDKHFGYSLKTKEHLLEAFKTFFKGNKDIMTLFLKKLQDLKDIFEANTHPFNFVSSSLLFVYDAERNNNNVETPSIFCGGDLFGAAGPENGTIEAPNIDLRLIDFAHVRYDKRKDDGCIVGIDTLIDLFSTLLLKRPS